MKMEKCLRIYHFATSLILLVTSQQLPQAGPPGRKITQPQPPQPSGIPTLQGPNPHEPSRPNPPKQSPPKPPTTVSKPVPKPPSKPAEPVIPRPPPTRPTRPAIKPPDDVVSQPEKQPSPGGSSQPVPSQPIPNPVGPPSRPPQRPPPQPPQRPQQPPQQPQRPQQPQPGRQQPQQSPNFQGTICESVCSCQQNQMICSQKNLRKIPKDPWPSGMTSADFDQNLISTLESNGFNNQQTQSLQTLTISFNNLKTIKVDVFQGLSSLQKLSLISNKIASLDAGAFNGLLALEVLNLQQNKLKEIAADPFFELNSLQELILDENNLETLEVDFFDRVPNIALLSLGANPWNCNCRLMGILIWTNAGNQVQGDPVCAEPDKMSRRELAGFSYSDVQTMCSDAWGDDPVISPEEERERQRMEDNCGEHTSSDPLDICYISNDVSTSPGQHVCIHCLGTSENEEESYLTGTEEAPSDYNQDYEDDLYSEIDISWSLPSSVNSSSEDNRITMHDNGTLCIDSVQNSDGGKYVCTIKLNNHTRTDSVEVNVASLAVQVAVGIVIAVVMLFGVISAVFVRWWFAEVGIDNSQIVPMDIQKHKQ